MLGQVSYIAAFVMLLVLARLQSFDRALEEAALDLGASHAQVLRRILLPHLYPAIGAGAAIAFFQSIENFNVDTVHARHLRHADRLCVLQGAQRHHADDQCAGTDPDPAHRRAGPYWYEISRRRAERQMQQETAEREAMDLVVERAGEPAGLNSRPRLNAGRDGFANRLLRLFY